MAELIWLIFALVFGFAWIRCSLIASSAPSSCVEKAQIFRVNKKAGFRGRNQALRRQ
jgi:hypothetical protein